MTDETREPRWNHFICPTCGHDFMVCDSCQTYFPVSQSRTCRVIEVRTWTTYGTVAPDETREKSDG